MFDPILHARLGRDVELGFLWRPEPGFEESAERDLPISLCTPTLPV